MSVERLLVEGMLDEAIRHLVAEVKAKPTDLARRTTLFELLGFAGEWDRAERQLDAIGHLDGGALTVFGVHAYRGLLAAERKRAKLFAEGLRPRFLLDPPEAVATHLEALDLARAGRGDEARARIDAAAAGPEIRGDADGEAFEGLRDADDLLGPVLEVFAPAGYCWVPWEQVQFLEVPPPAGLRDLLWAPAKLASFDGQLGEVFLPCLYPGSAAEPDGAIRLGRVTDWREQPGGLVRGAGRKLFLVGEEARTLQEIGTLQFWAGASTSPEVRS